ncbi:hypothetical protein [Streptomyces sp. G1]|uniref:hypothetical protein n=1 Tax=Streptomyces sp. G1 TaxID=361572 RepID=UPI00202F099E|nr:hypothetical protein [Streptomyces sp. G1]MCM1965104.1 hypothetical protein [Streptomyces sp. G1]
MRPKVPNGQLAALLTEADWSSGELAKVVNALGNAQGLALRYDRTSVAHWLSGSRPKDPVPHLVAATFTQRLGRLVSPWNTGLTSAPDPMQPAVAGGVDAMHQLIELCRNDVDPARRALITESPYAITGVPPLDRLQAGGPLAEAAFPAQRRTTAADVAILSEVVETFASFARRFGGKHARIALAGYIAEDVGRLLTRPAPDHVRRELLTCTAQLTHLLGNMTSDSGQAGLSQHYYNLALDLAAQAGDRRQYAITLRALSTQALHLGHYRHAHDLADAAVDIAGTAADGAVGAYVLVQRALVRSYGQHRLARADLTEAERRYTPTGSPHGAFTGYPRSALEYQRGAILDALGDHTAAQSAWEASLAHRPDDQHRPLALTHARMAEALLRQGHLDAACSHWDTFLGHYPYLHSTYARRALARLCQYVGPYQRHPQAAVVLARARELNHPVKVA